MMNDNIEQLPGLVQENSLMVVDNICGVLGIPRDAISDNKSIKRALKMLPDELENFPEDYINNDIARLCVAVSVGLYDDAIVRMWNCVIRELRKQVNKYGIEMIKHVLDSTNLDEKKLESISDAELLTLSRQLSILSEEGYFFLDKCRDIRNNASIAHPTDFTINETRLIAFINDCCKYGLNHSSDGISVDFKKLMNMISSTSTSNDQLDILVEEISNSFESQRDLIWQVLYSRATDNTQNNATINNASYISEKLANNSLINEKNEIYMLGKHNEFQLDGDNSKVTLSRKFLEKIDRISNIREAEKVDMFNKEIMNLQNAHTSMDNFYNEVPFASRLNTLYKKINPVPEIVINELVTTILNCYLGNGFGVSNQSMPYYKNILFNLSPKGIQVLINLPYNNVTIKNKLKNKNARERFKEILDYIDEESLITTQKVVYNKLIDDYFN